MRREAGSSAPAAGRTSLPEVRPQVRDRADGRLRPLGAERVVFPAGRDLVQPGQIRVEQQRSVVQHAAVCDLLRAAGDLFPVHGHVAGAAFLRRDTEGVQRPQHRGQTAVIVQRAALAGDQRVIEIAGIMIDRPAAGHAAHDWDVLLHKRAHMDLAADVLIAADHDRRAVAPEQQHLVLPEGPEHIIFKRLIEKRVMRCCFDLNHVRVLPFSDLFSDSITSSHKKQHKNNLFRKEEVIGRRFDEYYKAEKADEGFGKLPDLILLDGGKGQVAVVKKVLREMNIDVPLFGLVKDDKHRTRAVTGDGGEISVSSRRALFTFLSKMQDEVHRFAIGYHHSRRSKNTFKSSLTDIDGIGEKRARAMLKYFRTIDNISKADLEELEGCPQMTKNAAIAVYRYFHSNEKTTEN